MNPTTPLQLPLNVRMSQDIGINVSTEDAPRLLAFIQNAVRAEIAKLQPRIEAAIAQSALDAGVTERKRIIGWLRDEGESGGLTPAQYADILAQGLPPEGEPT